MKTEKTRIRFELGNIDGPGNYYGFLTEADLSFEDAEWVVRSDGYEGRGEGKVEAVLNWIRQRCGC